MDSSSIGQSLRADLRRLPPDGKGIEVAAQAHFDAIDEARKQWIARWPQAALSMATTTSIMRAQQLALRSVDGALRPFGLTFARYEALVLLSFTRSGELPLGKMGRRLMIHPTSVTNIVDRLTEDELTERIPHPNDRRATLARITPKGRAIVELATEAVNSIDFGVGSLSTHEQQSIVDIVRNLREQLGDLAT